MEAGKTQDALRKGKRTVWVYSIIMIALCIADGVLTYLGTPDLALEGNPLVKYLGLGWGTLFSVNVAFLILYVLSLRYTFVKYQSPVIAAKNFTQYDCMLYFNEPGKFSWLLYKMPKNWKPVGAAWGYVMGPAFIIARLILVLGWTMYLTNSQMYASYQKLRAGLWSGRLDLWVAMVVAMILLVVWHVKEYKANQKAARVTG